MALGTTDPLHRYAFWQFGKAVADGRRPLREPIPRFEDTRPLRWQHTVLKAVETLSMDRR